MKLTARLSKLEQEHDAGYATPQWGRALREAPPIPLKGGDFDMTPTLRRFARLVGVEVLEAARALKSFLEESGGGELTGGGLEEGNEGP